MFQVRSTVCLCIVPDLRVRRLRVPHTMGTGPKTSNSNPQIPSPKPQTLKSEPKKTNTKPVLHKETAIGCGICASTTLALEMGKMVHYWWVVEVPGNQQPARQDRIVDLNSKYQTSNQICARRLRSDAGSPPLPFWPASPYGEALNLELKPEP